MKKINLLSKEISQLIAAGEVVERPVSVLKELLENSIDSGATRITIEIKNGGVKLIKVTDNGSGIYKDDVKNAFLRHATSKLKCAEDLNNINSLGFRGEALASICAVSKLEIITKTKEETEGTHYFINGGVPSKIEYIGCTDGTTIIVKDLFYNVPARMKFLKKDVAEGNACAGIIDKLALSHPEIAFKFIRDGKIVLNTPGNGKIYSAIYCVYGKEFIKNMVEVDYELNNIKVTGFVSKPIYSKPTKNMQHFFVNKRYVKSKLGSSALEEAFKNSVMVGKFPYCVIYIEISPQLVDVNVHPSKTEVKFVNDKSVFEAIYYAVKSALMQGDENKIASASMSNVNRLSDSFNLTKEGFAYKPKVYESEHLVKSVLSSQLPQKNLKEDVLAFTSQKTPRDEILECKKIAVNEDESKEKAVSDEKKEIAKDNNENVSYKLVVKTGESIKEKVNSNLKESSNAGTGFASVLDEKMNILGEIFKCYIVIEYGGKMIMVDKHAAHERIIFERLKSNKDENNSQILLEPKVVQMEKNEYSTVVENLDLLSKAGFDIDDFGAGSVIVRSAPMYIEPHEIPDTILEMAEYIGNNKKDIDSKKLDWLYHNIACRAAVKAGNKSSKDEIIMLIKALIENPEVKYCPHGRPIFIDFSKKFIEKQFGRI